MVGTTQAVVAPLWNTSTRESGGSPLPPSPLLRAQVSMSAAAAHCWVSVISPDQSLHVVALSDLGHVWVYSPVLSSPVLVSDEQADTAKIAAAVAATVNRIAPPSGRMDRLRRSRQRIGRRRTQNRTTRASTAKAGIPRPTRRTRRRTPDRGPRRPRRPPGHQAVLRATPRPRRRRRSCRCARSAPGGG